MYFPTRYATKITAASISLITVTFSLRFSAEPGACSRINLPLPPRQTSPAQKPQKDQKSSALNSTIDRSSPTPT